MAETSLLEKTKTSTKIKQKHKVIMYNDKTTDFMVVMLILVEVFQKSEAEAYAITKAIHNSGPNGSKVVKEYSSLSLARTKVAQAKKLAKDKGYPNFRIEAK